MNAFVWMWAIWMACGLCVAALLFGAYRAVNGGDGEDDF